MCCWWPNANVKFWDAQLQNSPNLDRGFVQIWPYELKIPIIFISNVVLHTKTHLTSNTKRCHIVFTTNYLGEALMAEEPTSKLELTTFVVVGII